MKGNTKDSLGVPNWDGTEACAGMDVELFYDETRKNQYQTRFYLERMRSLCGSCHRLNECRDYAIKHEYYGFWGGMTLTERREYRIKHKIPLVRAEIFSDCLPKLDKNGESNDSQYATD